MFRSLHMKLVLIMMLLIVSLMTVVGAFLINSVVGYYLRDFHTQMEAAFTNEENSAERIGEVLNGNNQDLGVDNRSRWYYVLDGNDGRCLAASDPELTGTFPTVTRNLAKVLNGERSASESDVSASIMDVAFRIERGGTGYIV